MKKITVVFAAFIAAMSINSVSAAPAPALSSQQVAAVGSTAKPITFKGNIPSSYDNVTVSALRSNLDYSGPTTVQVLVLEQGYASSSTRIARLDGRAPSRVTTYPVLKPDKTVSGYWVLYEFFNVNPVNSARFTASSTSLVFPYRTFSDAIIVR
jgi:hypothetical protein